MYGTVFGLLVFLIALSLIYSSTFNTFLGPLILIVGVMIIGVYFYPSAKISLFEDHLEFKKGKQKISVPWKDILNIHKDPVFAKNIFSYYLARRFYMGGVFLETTQGYSKYFAPQLIRAEGSSQTWKDLVKEIESRSSARIKEGEVSIFKQKSKLFDIVFILLAIFIVPIFLILLYGLFTGTLDDSITTLRDLF